MSRFTRSPVSKTERAGKVASREPISKSPRQKVSVYPRLTVSASHDPLENEAERFIASKKMEPDRAPGACRNRVDSQAWAKRGYRRRW